MVIPNALYLDYSVHSKSVRPLPAHRYNACHVQIQNPPLRLATPSERHISCCSHRRGGGNCDGWPMLHFCCQISHGSVRDAVLRTVTFRAVLYFETLEARHVSLTGIPDSRANPAVGRVAQRTPILNKPLLVHVNPIAAAQHVANALQCNTDPWSCV